MSEQPVNNNANDELESRLQEAARSFTYPPTPDIAGAVRQQISQPMRPVRRTRRLALAAAILLAVLLTLLAVPQVRAVVAEFLRVGAIIIRLTEPSPTSTGTLTSGSSLTAAPTILPRSILDLAGETTLENARKKANFNLRLPTYPPDLGLPDHVYMQDMGGPLVVLVWVDPQNPAKVRLSLHILGPLTDGFGQKGNPTLIEHTKVKGIDAVWLDGPHMLEYYVGHRIQYDLRRLVTGHVLLWEQDTLTYRLETDLTMEEAVKIAESIQ
jgi:hypothetical protein